MKEFTNVTGHVTSFAGPKEGERVARGHFHEKVGGTSVHWLSECNDQKKPKCKSFLPEIYNQ